MSRSEPSRRPYERERDDFLSVEEIVDTALALTEEVGFSGVSMRALGDRLGVSHMAVYHYVAGKRALQETSVYISLMRRASR